MRISVDKDTEFYRPDYMQFRAFLDDAEVPDCVAASEEDGWVESHVRNAEGELVVAADENSIVRARRYGRVEIRRRI